MFAPALMSVLLMPTFASTPTFGFTLTPVCANAGLNAPITAAAAALSNRFLRLIHRLLSGWGSFGSCGEYPHKKKRALRPVPQRFECVYARESDCSSMISRSARPSRFSSTEYIAEALAEESSMPISDGCAKALPAAIASTVAPKRIDFARFTVFSYRNVTRALPQDSCRHTIGAKEVFL